MEDANIEKMFGWEMKEKSAKSSSDDICVMFCMLYSLWRREKG
jgi:hypothetical protein